MVAIKVSILSNRDTSNLDKTLTFMLVIVYCIYLSIIPSFPIVVPSPFFPFIRLIFVPFSQST